MKQKIVGQSGRIMAMDKIDPQISSIKINGKNIIVEGVSLRWILGQLLSQIDIKNPRLFVIKKNLKKIYDIMEEYCIDRMDVCKGKQRAEITRLLSTIEMQKKYWLREEDKEKLQSDIYDFLLSVEGFGTLKGFGAQNRMGDTLCGNPEKISIEKMQTSAERRLF
jgi:hypothetical protein